MCTWMTSADWGVKALECAAQGLTCTTAVHICYGYGIKANTDWKKTLGGEWRQYEETFPALRQARFSRSRWNAATRGCRWNCSACSRAR